MLMHIWICLFTTFTPLQALISGQQQSKYVPLTNTKRIVNIYLEDERQQDEVYDYLKNLYKTVTKPLQRQDSLNFTDVVPFILDVLLPEVSLLGLCSDLVFTVRVVLVLCDIVVLLHRPSFMP